MIIGIPKEIKIDENRVGLLPAGAEQMAAAGHYVLVETGAGLASGARDEDYLGSGASIVYDPAEIYRQADLVIKVKEPLPREYGLVRSGQVVFCYFHFAADRGLTEAMQTSRSVAIAYETVKSADGSLPLLIPMSEVAGRMAVQEGAKHLEKPRGGRGILLSGVPGVAPADVVVIGGGVVGSSAARIAAGIGANVFILDVDLKRLRYLADVMPPNVTTLMSNPYNLKKLVASADLLIAAVLIPGAKAPKLVTREMIRTMKEGAVLVDVAVDQGGCSETCRPTTHRDPTYVVNGVIHYCVTNMPGAVPRTSTFALTNATFRYALEIANKGWREAARTNPEIAAGVNMVEGTVTHPGVAEAWGIPVTPLRDLLE
ncbi:MAG: alanine dehydrogenase [Deltaproteobacteria bacterium]|nr:alanine dehydrogenase [Deltaproteobacteria bacterium]